MNSTLSKSFLSDKLVSVLIPAYNEENAIIKTIKDLESALSRSGWGYEIIVVDDSSTDGTAQAAKTTGVRVLSHPKNIGYGGALRTGEGITDFTMTGAAGFVHPKILDQFFEQAGVFL